MSETENINNTETILSDTIEEKHVDWFNINHDILLSRAFIENCVLYTTRSGSTITIHTIRSQDDIQIKTSKEQDAVRVMRMLETILNLHTVESNVNFENEIISAEGL